MMTVLGALVKEQPAEAKKRIVRLLRKSEGDPERAARAAGVTRRTFDRWMTELELLERAAEIRARMGRKEAP